jgi:hypothetical protein
MRSGLPTPPQPGVLTLLPADNWHDDLGEVLWWRVPICEAPFVGSPLGDDWLEDYYTHFSLFPHPQAADGDLQLPAHEAATLRNLALEEAAVAIEAAQLPYPYQAHLRTLFARLVRDAKRLASGPWRLS